MSANNASDLPTVSDRLAKNAMRHASERIIEMLLFAAAAVSVLTTAGIVYVLVTESINFFQNVSIVDFLTDTQWTPLFDDAHFGIMVLISGTVVSSAVALAVAIPMGTAIAIYLSEFANSKVREIAKPVLELLGGIPTIVFGYFALLMVTPLLQKVFPELPGLSLLSAGLVMGIMIVSVIPGQFQQGHFSWITGEADIGFHTVQFTFTDNNACGTLQSTCLFNIKVMCRYCPSCVYYENRSPSGLPLPELTIAGACIVAGTDVDDSQTNGPVETGNASVTFKAPVITLEPGFTGGPGFVAIPDLNTCVVDCEECCAESSGITVDEPLANVFTPNGDGVNDVWQVTDQLHPYCAYNANAFDLWIYSGPWGNNVVAHRSGEGAQINRLNTSVLAGIGYQKSLTANLGITISAQYGFALNTLISPMLINIK